MSTTNEENFVLPEGIKDFVFKYRIQEFLKKNQRPFSGDLNEKLKQAISSDEEMFPKFSDFILEEVSNGKNRLIFWCDFSVESISNLGSIDKIVGCLKRHDLPSEPFNNLLLDKEFEQGEMVYFNIEEDPDEQLPSKISFCFIHFEEIPIQDEDGYTMMQKNYSYVWINIYPVNQYLEIKCRPYFNNNLLSFHQNNRLFSTYHNWLAKTFNISFLNMSESKGILYNIFKKLTEKAELGYRNTVEEIYGDVEEKLKELIEKIGLTDINNPVELPNRVCRLLERALILSDLDGYMAYDPDKLGVIDRIDFSDQSGARINALSQEEGIEIADIYFDTKETIDTSR
ncbi:hypothetical protein, partial [Priestia aryabhattai]|uniref:hypothetical protein n=2 Tax=Bacillaceae TaxID=186817 RepID=UPI002E1ABFA1|nr:hypothetical protein [Priestia aryabhattai]